MKADEVMDLQGEFLRLAYNAGCVAVGASAPAEEVDPDPEPEAEVPGPSRMEQIQAAIRELIDRNDGSGFTSTGSPYVREVAVILGDEVKRSEVEEAFAAMSAD